MCTACASTTRSLDRKKSSLRNATASCACTRAVSRCTPADTSATSARSSPWICCAARCATSPASPCTTSPTSPTSTTRRSPSRRRPACRLREYTTRFIDAFREDAAALGLESPEDTPRATDQENLVAMADMIAALEQRGHTYRSDGSIYFKISTLPQYGQLARLDHVRHDQRRPRRQRQVREGGRARLRPLEGRPRPTSRPGTAASVLVAPAGTSSAPRWRCACSGPAPIDIHCGGVDLIFPHHENEIAQAEGATGQSSSRGSGTTSSICSWTTARRCRSRWATSSRFATSSTQGYRASALRYLLISVHYRKQLRFSWVTLQQAEEAVKRLYDCVGRLERVKDGSGADGWDARLDAARTRLPRQAAGRRQRPRRTRRGVRTAARSQRAPSTPAR